MSWGLFFSLLGLPFRAIGRALAGWWRWASEDGRHAAISGLLILLVVNAWVGWRASVDRDGWRGKATVAMADAKAWKAAHTKLVTDVAAAQKAAAAADRANVARVAAAFTQINQRTAHEYQDRLGDSAAAVQRLRDQLAQIAARNPGGRGEPPVPEAITARCRAFGAADCDALLAALPGQLHAAEANTAQLIALQDYVRSLLAVDYAGEAAPAPQAANQ